jgi:hypothetical protein
MDDLTPEQWRAYMLAARRALHINPHDAEALAAVKDANDAINRIEQAQVPREPGLGESIVGGIQGLGNLARHTAEGGLDLLQTELTPNANSIPGPGGIPMNPDLLPKLAKGLYETLASPVRVTARALREGNVTPAEASESFGGAAAALGAPFVEGIVPKGGPVTNAIGRTLRAPMDWLQRAGVNNELTRARTARVNTSRATAEATSPEQIAQAKLRTQLMEQRLSQGAQVPEAALRRLQLLEQRLARGPATAESIELGNELKRLKIEMMGQNVSDFAASEPTPPSSVPQPVTNAVRNMSPAEFEEHPMGQTPPLEQSAAAPGVMEARAAAASRLMLKNAAMEPAQLAQGNPLTRLTNNIEQLRANTPPEPSPLDALGNRPGIEPVENLQGEMGQKSLQFGEGSPMNLTKQAEVKKLLGEFAQHVAKRSSSTQKGL